MRKARPAFGGLALAWTLGMGGCGADADSRRPSRGGPPDTPPTAASPDTAGGDSVGSAYLAVDVTDGGTLRGTVRFTGAAPPPRTVTVTADATVCGATREVRTVRVGTGGGVADVVVSLADVRRGKAFPAAPPPTLDQSACRFSPHVLVAPLGSGVRVTNSDPLTHNVHTAAFENRSVNRTQPADLEAIELRFDAPETVHVKCDLHPWMSAWIVVAEHPYHAITDESGAFTLSDVPAGTHTVEIWHETLGSWTSTVTVAAGETVELTFDLAKGG